MRSSGLGIMAAALALAGAACAADALPPGRPAAGGQVFHQCMGCHTVGAAAQNGVGPALNGVVGRAAGQAPGFRYSSAMRGSGLVWDAATLSKFLTAPAQVVPGTRMSFPGLASPQDRADVIAYLKQYLADGKSASTSDSQRRP